MKYTQNKIHIALLAVALVSGFNAVALASDAWPEQPESVKPESFREDHVASVGIGALIGGLAGGPPGLIIGIIGMNAIDSYQQQHTDIETTELSIQDKLADQHDQVVTVGNEKSLQTEAIAAFESDHNTTKQLASLSDIKPENGHDELRQALATHFEQWVQFRTAQAELEPHLKQQLTRAAKWMSQMPAVRIELHGFTDPRGADQDNMSLSRARLDSVRRALIAGGIDAGRITGYAHGESLPLYTGDDHENNYFERRVLISFQVQGVQS